MLIKKKKDVTEAWVRAGGGCTRGLVAGTESSRGVCERAGASRDRTSDSLAWQGAGVLVMRVQEKEPRMIWLRKPGGSSLVEGT